jgi:hypothetical protein
MERRPFTVTNSASVHPDRDGSLVADAGRRACLDQETAGGGRMGTVGRRVAQDVLFEGDGSVQQLVLGQPHPAHTAAAQERPEPVPTCHEARPGRCWRASGNGHPNSPVGSLY